MRISYATTITRRTFGGLATTSFTAAYLPAAPFHLNVGVGAFSYHLLSLDEMIVQLKANHIQDIEMSRGEFMLMKPPTQEMVETARRKHSLCFLLHGNHEEPARS